jgi:serine/threonine protein kinase
MHAYRPGLKPPPQARVLPTPQCPRLEPKGLAYTATDPVSAGADESSTLIPMRLLHRPLPSSTSPQQPPASTASFLKTDDLLRLRLIARELNIPIFNLPENFGVRVSDPGPYQAENKGIKVPYLLGRGASCSVVQHETDDSTIKAVESGTIVALKRYTHDASADDLATDKRLAEVILQDLRVLCHPRLRSHENFSRLLYMSWEPYSLVPVLALELASFGTLLDVLESEFKMSWLQKCHVSLDITLGLHHLHDCGFVHGDIKPANIMLQKHKSRQVVAKLMDFSGATDIVHYGTATHSKFMSRLWLPPEMLLMRLNIDYKKVDSYAYGMLMTQIWCDTDFEVYESYLETLVPEFFTDVEKQTLIMYYKCCPKDDVNSLLEHSHILIANSEEYSQSIRTGFRLDILQEGTLVPDPNERWDFHQILQRFHDFAQHQGREIP